MDLSHSQKIMEFSRNLDLLVLFLKSGCSFLHAIEVMVQVYPTGGLTEIWTQYLWRIRLGSSQSQSLEVLEKGLSFLPNPGLLCHGLKLSLEQGMPLSDFLSEEAEHLRILYVAHLEKSIFQKQFKLFFPLFLFILPAVFIALLTPIVIELLGELS
ncbi:MAG: type II secretion system F family protein [Deltaproteobacteria bacterium]|nr:type II secretion system F family protein [Deltaproteobacteria bacterium]